MGPLHRPLMAVSLALALSACGCRVFTADKFEEPRFDVRGHNLLLLPFRQGKLWYYESPRGSEMARAVAVHLQENCSSALMDDSQVQKQILENFEDPPPLARWGKAAGARFVIYGDLIDLSTRRQSIIGMVQGHIQVSFQVWDVEKDQLVFEDESIELSFPRDPSRESAGVFEFTEEEIYRKLLTRAAERVAGAVCGRRVDPTDPSW